MVFFGSKAASAATGGWPGGAAVLKLVGIMHCIDTYVAELTMVSDASLSDPTSFQGLWRKSLGSL